MELIVKGGGGETVSPWKEACRCSSVPNASSDIQFALFNEEGDAILGLGLGFGLVHRVHWSEDEGGDEIQRREYFKSAN